MQESRVWVQSDAGKESLRAQVLSGKEALACALRWRQDRLRYTVERAGLWMQPPPHFCSISGSEALLGPDSSSAGPTSGMSEQMLPASGFVSLCGIELPCRGTPGLASAAQSRGPFVMTETVSRNLEAAALVLCQRRPLLLEGPPGESSPVGPHPAGFQMHPSVENRPERRGCYICRVRQVCLGGKAGSRHREQRLYPYACGRPDGCQEPLGCLRVHHRAWGIRLATRPAHPGIANVHSHIVILVDTFYLGLVLCELASCLKAQPFPLQAVAEGKWLVIEDINLAPMDVLAALIPLLERRQLQLPQRAQSLSAAEGFQLLATITSSPGARLSLCLPYYLLSIAQICQRTRVSPGQWPSESEGHQLDSSALYSNWHGNKACSTIEELLR